MTRSRPRVAIAHDYLTQRGGAERVVLSLVRAFPDATLHTLVYDPEQTYPEFRDAHVVTSPLNKVSAFRRDPRLALPFLARAASRFRVDADVVVTSTSGWAHGFTTNGRVLAYCHNPPRWIYQTDEYLGQAPHRSPVGLALLGLRPFLRRWDRRAAVRVDRYLANSRVVAERIRRSYGVVADVVPAPHGMRPDAPHEPVPELLDWAEGGYHLVVSRLLPYKNVDKVLAAFAGRPERLVVVGHGPEEQRLRARLRPNMRMLSGLSDAQLRYAYAHAQALMAPSLEDFGLTPLEANSFGKPVLALRAGGYLDTVVEGETGLFFDDTSPESLRAAIHAGRMTAWSTPTLLAHAEKFSAEHFIERIRREVDGLTAPVV